MRLADEGKTINAGLIKAGSFGIATRPTPRGIFAHTGHTTYSTSGEPDLELCPLRTTRSQNTPRTRKYVSEIGAHEDGPWLLWGFFCRALQGASAVSLTACHTTVSAD